MFGQFRTADHPAGLCAGRYQAEDSQVLANLSLNPGSDFETADPASTVVSPGMIAVRLLNTRGAPGTPLREANRSTRGFVFPHLHGLVVE
jgi:hypothetical protein